MPEQLRISAGPALIGIWRIDESEEQLKAFIGGDSFPILAQFNATSRRREWLATRCQLKQLGITDSIIYAPDKRPYLAHGQYQISISHSTPYAALIVSRRFHVGLDIEALDRPYGQIAQRVLTLGERQWANTSNSAQMAIIWSIKEAIYKHPAMQGLNSFDDVVILPFTPTRNGGLLQLRARIKQRVYPLHFAYHFLNTHVITWLISAPQRQFDDPPRDTPSHTTPTIL